LIQVRSGDIFAAVKANVGVTEVIGEDHNDIRFRGGFVSVQKLRYKQEYAEEESLGDMAEHDF
jgi:hypothetical protein